MCSVFVLIETVRRCLKIIDARLAKSTIIAVTVTVILGFLSVSLAGRVFASLQYMVQWHIIQSLACSLPSSILAMKQIEKQATTLDLKKLMTFDLCTNLTWPV